MSLAPSTSAIACLIAQASSLLQLLNPAGRVLWQHANATLPLRTTLPFFPAGDLTLRLVDDQNQNGIPDGGSLSANRQPESIRIYPAPITLRAGWEFELDLAAPPDLPKPGRPKSAIPLTPAPAPPRPRKK